jgi:hypothetical protein
LSEIKSWPSASALYASTLCIRVLANMFQEKKGPTILLTLSPIQSERRYSHI